MTQPARTASAPTTDATREIARARYASLLAQSGQTGAEFRASCTSLLSDAPHATPSQWVEVAEAIVASCNRAASPAVPSTERTPAANLLDQLLDDHTARQSAPVPAPAPVGRIVSKTLTDANVGKSDTVALAEDAEDGIEVPEAARDIPPELKPNNSLRKCRTGTDIATASGLGWRVRKDDIANDDGTRSDFSKIVRADTGRVLHVASRKFGVVQNDEFLGSLEPLIAAGAQVVGAGSFRDGGTVWAQLDLKCRSAVRKGDDVHAFALIRNGHDGSSCFKGLHTPVRVRCWNTLQHALSEGAQVFSFRHTANVAARVQDAGRLLGELLAQHERNVKVYRRLAETKISSDDVLAVVRELFPKPEDELVSKILLAKRQRQTDEVLAAIRGSIGYEDQTGWDVWNGINQWARDAAIHSTRCPDRAAESILVGHAAEVSEGALQNILALCKIPVGSA